MKGPFLITLDITTFRGMSIGAEHWYGKLHVRGKSDRNGTLRGGYGAWRHPVGDVELERPLGEEEATYLREKDGDSYWPQAGEMTRRFNSRGEVKDAALEAFQRHFQKEDLLVWDRHGEMMALAGAKFEEFNKVSERDQWKWLHEAGFLQDKEWNNDTRQG